MTTTDDEVVDLEDSYEEIHESDSYRKCNEAFEDALNEEESSPLYDELFKIFLDGQAVDKEMQQDTDDLFGDL